MALDGLSNRAVMGMFYEEMEADVGDGWLAEIAMAIDSDQESEVYPWLGQVPKMQVSRDQLHADQLSDQQLIVLNEDYDAAIKIPKRWMRRDKTGQVRQRIGEVADTVRELDYDLIVDLIAAGESTACYDGQFFFDTDHSEGASGTQSNDLSVDVSASPAAVAGSTTNPSPEEMNDAILQGIQQMIGFKDDKGRYINRRHRNFLVMVAPSLMRAAATGLGAVLINSGSTNPIDPIVRDGFRIQLTVEPSLSAFTAKFPIFSLDGRQKPFILQREYQEEVMLGLDSEYAQTHNHCLFGAKAGRGAAYGDWRKACLVTMT